MSATVKLATHRLKAKRQVRETPDHKSASSTPCFLFFRCQFLLTPPATPTMLLALHILLLMLMRLALADPPLVACSWKPFTDSPENHGYRWFCNAQKKQLDGIHGEYRCDDKHWATVADIGYVEPYLVLLRFR